MSTIRDHISHLPSATLYALAANGAAPRENRLEAVRVLVERNENVFLRRESIAYLVAVVKGRLQEVPAEIETAESPESGHPSGHEETPTGVETSEDVVASTEGEPDILPDTEVVSVATPPAGPFQASVTTSSLLQDEVVPAPDLPPAEE